METAPNPTPNSPERRTAPRETSLWRARVRKPLSVSEVEFELKDFSSTGLFLRAATDEARSFAQAAQPGLLVEILIPDRNDEIVIQARGSVIRSGSDGIGIRLRDAARECVSFLRLVTAATLPEAQPAEQKLLPEQVRSQSMDALHQYFLAALERYFATLDQDLFQAAKRSRNPTEEGDLLRARKQLLENRKLIVERFFSALMSADSVPVPVRDKAGLPLKLIERDELESSLASAELASHAEARHGEQLTELRSQLSAAFAGQSDLAMVAQPARYVRALNSALADQKLDPALRPQLYRTFQDQALNGLNTLFEQVGELLTQGGIRATQARAAPIAPTTAPLARPVSAPTRALELSARPSAGRARSAVNSALNLVSRAQSTRNVSILPSQQLDDDELINELTRLIAEEAHTGSGPQIEQLVMRFEATDQPARKALNNHQFEALDLLKRLSRSVHSDGLLPDAFFRWYQMLEPRLLADRLKLDDPTPAALLWREVLGSLEFAAQTLRGRVDPAALEQGAKVEALVAELSQGTPGDERPFVIASALLAQMFGRQMKAAKASEVRVADACAGQQRLNDARRHVERELGAAFGGRPIARSLQALIDESVRDLLVLKAVQIGVSNPLWSEAFGALKSLSAALCAPRGDQDALRGGVASIERLKFQLEQLAGDPNAQSVLVKQIENELLNGKPELLTYTPHPSQEAELPKPIEASTQQRLHLLDLGDWLGLIQDDLEVRPAKLVWRAADYSRFVFVSQSGKKSHDLSSVELLERLDTGQAKVLEDWHLNIADRAWRRVVEDLHNELAHLATHDELTGLLNRREFERLLSINLGAASEALASGGLLLIGLDGFARVNANLDWASGDYALKAVAEALVVSAPPQSLLGRLESDRFVLWLPDIDVQQACACANKLLQSIRDTRPTQARSDLRLTASAGVVAPLLGGAQQALKDVNIALLRAKEAGRDRVAQIDEGQAGKDSLFNAYQWLERLEQALATSQLTLFSQPLKDLSTPDGSPPTHVEVLARLLDGTQFILPEFFLPVAERFNRMGAIDRHVVRELFTQLQAHRRAFDSLKTVAFNVSAKSLTDADFIEFLITESKAANLDPRKLCIEVTETVAIRDLALAKQFMLRLKDHGFLIALDDFGSGWASYQYLKHLPVDFIKIDGAFIRDLAASEQDFAMVRSINDLAHVLGKKTVGEHVSDAAVLKRVRELDLDFAQGYALGRPEPFAAFLKRLQ